MSSVAANGIRIEYEEFGDPCDPAVVLVMGYSAQMVVWPEAFCRALAEQSLRVIRFDNRDVGLSTHLDGVKAPGMLRCMFGPRLGLRLSVPYSLDDMALDTLGLMDALHIDRAHIVGASMGGMIAQIIAAKHPDRAASLTSIMSTSGNRKLPGPRPKVLRHAVFKNRKNFTREQTIEYLIEFFQMNASPAYPVTLEERRERITAWLNRSFDPAGTARQFAAMATTPDRTALLATIEVPVLVIHGEEDPLIPAECGRHTAQCIKNADLHVFPGMGHDLPEQLIPQLTGLIASHCAASDVAGNSGTADLAETA
ncbi:MAG: alpha/beta hydrolase [Woeseiaceae bacterium]